MNPTRRGDIKLDRCECGYSRKKKKWVRNGCKIHAVVPGGKIHTAAVGIRRYWPPLFKISNGVK